MATTTEQRSKIEALKREIWAAKTITDQALQDVISQKKAWAKAEEKYVTERMKLDALKFSLIAALDDLAL